MEQHKDKTLIIRLDKTFVKKKNVFFKATSEDCLTLAQRAGILGIEFFTIKATIFERDQNFEVKGSIEAEIKQECVVSLQPFNEKVNIPFRLIVVTNGKRSQENEDIEDVEIIPGELFDLKEVASQYFCLQIDPYPRHPDINS